MRLTISALATIALVVILATTTTTTHMHVHAATDGAADLFLNIFSGLYAFDEYYSQWKTNKLEDWKCIDKINDKTGFITRYSCCTKEAGTGLYECEFRNLRGYFGGSFPTNDRSFPIKKLSLKSNGTMRNPWQAGTTKFDLNVLPTAIETLIIHQVNLWSPRTYWANLSRGMTHLEVYKMSHAQDMTFADLPRGLTYLRWDECWSRGLLDYKDLPDTLTYIKLRKNRFTGCVGCLGDLKPRKVTYLDMYDAGRAMYGQPDLRKSSSSSSVPPTLATLYLGPAVAVNGSLDLTDLPKNMTTLDIGSTGMSGPVDFTKLKTSDKLANLHLPKNKFSGTPQLWDAPETLKKLDIQGNLFSGPADFKWIPFSLEEFSFQNNKFDSFFTFPSPQQAQQAGKTYNLKFVIGHKMQMTGDLDMALMGDHFPNLDKIEFYQNNFSSLSNFNKISPRVKTFLAHTNFMEGRVEFDERMRNDSMLENLQLYRNYLTGPCADTTYMPRNLKYAYMWDNYCNGVADLRNMPKNMRSYRYARNHLTSLVGLEYLRALSPELYYASWHSNFIVSQLNLTNGLPKKMKTFYAFNNSFYGDVTTAHLYKSKSLEKFRVDYNKLCQGKTSKAPNCVIDMTRMPINITEFYFRDNYGYFDFRGVESVNDMPANFFGRLKSVCTWITYRNSVRHLPICNLTQTVSRTLFSRTKTFTKTRVPTPTRTHLPTDTASASKTVTMTHSISDIDPTRSWLLNVVFNKVTNIPPEWRFLKLTDWPCKLDPVGYTKVPCCSKDADGKYQCKFRFLEGTADVRFTELYPLSLFWITKSPALNGSLEIGASPIFMKDFRIEGTQLEVDPKVGMQYSKLPHGLETISVCDSNIALPDVSFGGAPATLKTVRLCGASIGGSRNFRGLPATLEHLDLHDSIFSGDVLWRLLPRGLRTLRLDANRFTGAVVPEDLPRGLRSVNLSDNAFDGTPDFNGTLPPALREFHASHNALGPAPPFFGNFSSSLLLEVFDLSSNKFAGALRDEAITGLAPLTKLERFRLAHNFLIGNFEAAAPLPPSLNLIQFCFVDNLLGNYFRESRTCDLTITPSATHTDSAGDGGGMTRSRSLDATPSPGPSLTDPHTASRAFLSKSSERTVSHSQATLSLSKSGHGNNVGTASHSPSASHSDAVPSLSKSMHATATPTPTLVVPYQPFVRGDELLQNVMLAGAIAATLVTPAAAAAATIVSRQNAIARTFGGRNRTCGGPDREDELDWFEDPTRMDLDGAKQSCGGRLLGTFVGNTIVAVCVSLPLWLWYAGGYVARTRSLPNFWHGADPGWPLEIALVFGYGIWMPIAFSCSLVASVRCGAGVGGAVSAAAIVVLPLSLFYLMWRRRRRERACPKTYFVSRRQCCFRTKRFVQWLFCPVTVWIWRPHEEMLAEMHRKQGGGGDDDKKTKKALRAAASRRHSLSPISGEHQEEDDDGDHDHDDDDGATPKKQKDSETELQLQQQLQQQQQQQQQQQEGEHVDPTVGGGGGDSENNNADTDAAKEPQSVYDTDAPGHYMDYDEQRFGTVSRALDKYVKKSWWFLCLELGIRFLMAVAPAVAEAVPPEFSCLAMRVIYLLCVNALLFFVISRRPYAHRALFIATFAATLAETVVLVTLLLSDDAGETVGPILLIITQILAMFLTIGIEFYEFVVERWWAWARGRVHLPEPTTTDEEEEEEAKEAAAAAAAAEKSQLEMQLMAAGAASGGDAGDAAAMSADGSGGASGARVNLSNLQQHAGGDADDDMDLLGRLDRNMRKAYRDLVANDEDHQVVENFLEFYRARDEFENEFDNL